MLKLFDRSQNNGIFKTNIIQNKTNLVLGFDIINGIGDAIILLSIIQNIIKDFPDSKVVFCSNLDNSVSVLHLLQIFDIKCDDIINSNRIATFLSDGEELFNNKYKYFNKIFYKFWDILKFNNFKVIDNIPLKINKIDLNKYISVSDYNKVISIQPYTFNKEKYLFINKDKFFMMKQRWNKIFEEQPEDLFVILGSNNDKKIGKFKQKNVISLMGQTDLKETCEIILSCNSHIAIESWTQIFCHVCNHQNIQFWDFNSFEIYKYLIGNK